MYTVIPACAVRLKDGSRMDSSVRRFIMSNEEKEKKEQILKELKQTLKGVREVSMADLEKIYAGMSDPNGMTG